MITAVLENGSVTPARLIATSDTVSMVVNFSLQVEH